MNNSSNIIINSIHTGPLRVNTYILNRDSRCVVVDPADAKKVNAYLAEHGLTLEAVLLTHSHFDHILGVAELQRGGAKVYIGALDESGLFDSDCNYNAGRNPFEPCRADVLLNDGDELDIAGIHFLVLHTPGHTAGGVCYVINKARTILSGDSLFRGSVGRCDLIGGSPVALHSSIKDKLFTLDGDYDVYPGHDVSTTLEYERQHNAYMKVSPSKW